MNSKKLYSITLLLLLTIDLFSQPNVITIPGTGHLAYGISPTGKYVTGLSSGGGGFLYKVTGAAFSNIGGEEAYAVNDLGKVVGTYNDSAFQYNGTSYPIAGFYENGSWSTPGLIPGMVPFSTSQYSYGYGISDDGSTMCGMVWEDAGTTRAFTWDAINMYKILKDKNQSAKAMCISGDGKVAGGWVQGNNRLPYFWNPDSVLLDPNVGEVHAINFNGSKMAGVASGSAFVRDSVNGMQYIPSIAGATGANAYGVSDSGIVVGYYNTGTLPPLTKTAFIYFPGQGMLDLRNYLISQNAANVPPVLDAALGISRDGRYIIAYGGFPRINYIIEMDSLSNGIRDSKKNEWISISPNPVHDGIINIHGNNFSKDAVLKLTDITGRELLSKNISETQPGNFTITFDLNEYGKNHFAPGTYFITLISSGKKTTSQVILY